MEILEPQSKRVLVIGGGVAGLEASRNLAIQGYNVCLLEKEPELGGTVKKLDHLYPEGMPDSHTLGPLIGAVKSKKNIEIITEGKILEVTGDTGNYEVTIKVKGKEKTLWVGIIIVATGFKEYDIAKVTPYGYGRYKNVIKPLDFDEMVSSGKIDLKKVNSVVIINCAGSRDKKYLSYCSRVCCFIGLKKAKLIKDMNPKTEVYICYIDMRSYGNLDSLYNLLRDRYMVNFIRGRPSNIEKKDGKLYVRVEDPMIDEVLNIEADYVILSHGYVGDEETLSKLNIPLDEDDKGNFPTTYCNASLSVDSNPRGILVCGAASYPKIVPETLSDARNTVLSALNTLKNIGLNTPVPEINTDICSQMNCKLCFSVCPYGAIVEENEKIKVISSMCMGCGICTATCPSGANQLEGFSDSEIYKKIEERVKPGNTVAFLCQWCPYPAYEESKNGFKSVKVIKIPCSGRISAGLILKAFNREAKNVLVGGCYPDSCHYIKGNLRAWRRVLLTKSLINQFGITQDSLRIEWICKHETDKLHRILHEMVGGA